MDLGLHTPQVCSVNTLAVKAPMNRGLGFLAPGERFHPRQRHGDAKALEHGASDEGAPGQRMDGFYGAYFRDNDGNKICFCHFG